MDFIDWLKSVITSTVAATAFSWLFLQALERALNRSVQRDIESHKTELYLRAQHQLELHKADLTLQSQQQVELIKHELQKQMLRAQLSTTKTHNVYSELFQKLRRADGVISSLWGFSSDPSFEGHSKAEIETMLSGMGTPEEERRKILDSLDTDRAHSESRIARILFLKRIRDARNELQEAQNHLALESIFMTKPVRDLAVSVLDHLHKAFVAVETSETVSGMRSSGINFQEKFDHNREQAKQRIAELEDAMRIDLFPGAIQR